MRNRRIGRLILLICLMIQISLLATGCREFTLIGSVNLGNGDAQEIADGESDADAGQIDVAEPCWPSAAAAFAEMRAHGFTPKKWPNVEAWFRRLEPLAESLPACE